MSEHYYLLENERESGPYTLMQLQAMWASGAVTARTLWRTDGRRDWQSFSALEPRLQPSSVAPYSPPRTHVTPSAARIVKRSSFAGEGCALQGLGLVCLILAAATLTQPGTGGNRRPSLPLSRQGWYDGA
jgi:hypothetical protein